jgi:hypothetical protein
VFKEAVSHEILSCVLIALDEHMSDPLKVLFILEGLAAMEKLSMTLALLPDEDLVRLTAVITRLSSRDDLSEVDGARVATVKSTFGVK